jgi:dolichyl-phosphate-mannose--protein O-mannosyl transferase
MKVKHIITLFLLGFGLSVMAAAFTILHFMGAPTMLLTSAIVVALATVLAIWKVFTNERIKDFLNS